MRYVRANILDREALSKVFLEARPAVVVHTVGVYRVGKARYEMEGKEGEWRVNVEGTRNVVDVCREFGVRGLVYTSSVTVVLDELGRDFRNVDERWPTGRARTSYGLSKVGEENVIGCLLIPVLRFISVTSLSHRFHKRVNTLITHQT